MTTIYRPNPESLAARVLGFFALNPDEELGFEDIVAKFVDQGNSRNVHTQLMAACDHDMLVYDSQEEVYRKGPVGLPSVIDRNSSKPAPAKRPGNWKKAKPNADDMQAAVLENELVATPAPALKKQPALAGKALTATKNIAKDNIQHQHVAGVFDEMDRARKGVGAPALPDADSAGASGKAGPDSQGCALGSSHAEGEEGGARAKELATDRIGTDGSGNPDSKGVGHRQPENGLEANRHDRVGSCARPNSSWEVLDAQGFIQAPDTGQPGVVHVNGALGQGDCHPVATGHHEAGAAQGPDNAGDQSTPQNAAGPSPIAMVRQVLLDTLADLRSKDNPMAIDRARAVADVATVIVNSARVEVEYLRVTQQRYGQFFEALPAPGGES